MIRRVADKYTLSRTHIKFRLKLCPVRDVGNASKGLKMTQDTIRLSINSEPGSMWVISETRSRQTVSDFGDSVNRLRPEQSLSSQ